MPPEPEANVRVTSDKRTVWLIAATTVAVLTCLLVTYLLVRAVLSGGEPVPTITWATLTPTAEQIAELSPVTSATPNSAGCEPDGEYIADATIPDDTPMSPGETFLKAWRVRNSGSCPWTEGYVLSFAEGERMGGEPRKPAPAANPGETAELSVSLTAPSDPGTYRGNWRLCVDEGACFGPRLYVQIVVEGTPAAETVPVPDPTSTATVAELPEVTASPPAPIPSPEVTSSVPAPDAGVGAWLEEGGRRMGVREVAWDTALNGFVADKGAIYLSLYIVAETTTKNSATFNGLEMSLIDGEGSVYKTVILERKDPPFGLCTARPEEPCEGWWTVLLPGRSRTRRDLILRWQPRPFAPVLETPIR